MRGWVAAEARAVAARAEEDLAALVAVSSPSGDVPGAEAAVAVARAMLPPEAEVERLPCSSPGHAEDLVGRLRGSGEGTLLLLGHLDTVVSHEAHRPLERREERLMGSGSVDMKGGVALALGVLRTLAGVPEGYAEVSLLLVNDEEWRRHSFTHAERFAGVDACLCFEAGQLAPGGEDAVVVRRKAAGTLRVEAHGAAAHSGAAPEKGRNALLALARAAEVVAERHDPEGEEHLTAVPTILHSGDAFNVVPAAGELFCDLRADTLSAIEAVVDALPDQVGGAALTGELIRRWPGMDARQATAGLLAQAGERLGRPVVGAARGGASDASHMAAFVPVTVDGLGPRGGAAHNPEEWVRADSLGSRAEVALAVAAAVLGLT
ncbi:MAG: M20/M25/M40 family metallo-hydrolase [Thermoleophilaceae bacterium]|jgi:glutamate carboxypeptidase